MLHHAISIVERWETRGCRVGVEDSHTVAEKGMMSVRTMARAYSMRLG